MKNRFMKRYKPQMILFLIIVLEAMILIGLVEYRSYVVKKQQEQESIDQLTANIPTQQVTTEPDGDKKNEIETMADIPKRDKNAASDAYKDDNKRIVCLDPALGGYAKGNSSETNQGLNESEYNLEFAKLIMSELNSQNVVVYMTREDASGIGEEERTELANDVYADLMVTLTRDSYDGKDQTGGISAWVHHKRPQVSDQVAGDILDKLESAGADINCVDAGTAQSTSDDYYTNADCIGPSLVLGMGSVLNEDDITSYEKNKEKYAKAVADAIVAWMEDQGL